MGIARRVVVVGACLVVWVACDRSGPRSTPPPPESWQPSRECSRDDECTPAPSCCPVPCTGDVINKRDVGLAQARVDSKCTAAERKECPQAGGCMEHRYACVRSRCAMVTHGSPDWPSGDGGR